MSRKSALSHTSDLQAKDTIYVQPMVHHSTFLSRFHSAGSALCGASSVTHRQRGRGLSSQNANMSQLKAVRWIVAAPKHFILRTILAQIVIYRFVVLGSIFNLRSHSIHWRHSLFVLDLTIRRKGRMSNNELSMINCHAASEFASMFIPPSQYGYISRPGTATQLVGESWKFEE